MKTPLRKVLAESHVAAIAIAILLFVALGNLFGALREPVYRAVLFLITFAITAIGERELPYISHGLDLEKAFMLLTLFIGFFRAVVALVGACLLSYWTYGVGPLRSLTITCSKLSGNLDA
jgi:hypothetical protein